MHRVYEQWWEQQGYKRGKPMKRKKLTEHLKKYRGCWADETNEQGRIIRGLGIRTDINAPEEPQSSLNLQQGKGPAGEQRKASPQAEHRARLEADYLAQLAAKEKRRAEEGKDTLPAVEVDSHQGGPEVDFSHQEGPEVDFSHQEGPEVDMEF
jgi:hypothetical protein